MITILCSGSRGDFQPYIALAQQLKKQGKDVRITGGQSIESLISAYGIKYFALSADYQTANIDPAVLAAAQSSDSPVKMLLTFNKMKKYVLGLTEEMYSACVGSELIIYHPGCTIGYFAGELLGIPSVLATPFPIHKTKEIASVIAYGKSKMPIALSYSLLQGMLWMAGKTGVKTLLKKKYGRLPKGFGCPFEKIDDKHPAVVSCSNYVFPAPKDWNKNIHQHGYWFIEENAEYMPPKALSDFLIAGEKPVYFGFGSVFNVNEKEEVVNIVVQAVKKCGRRGILCGMGEIKDLPEDIISIGSIPHSWLFKQCAVVCHHGGAGTAAAAFRAGVPSVIIPFSNDQFAWAHRAYDLRVASKPIYKKNLTADRLIEAINYVLNEDISENAEKLAENIATENGALNCAKVINGIIEKM
jgi:sterol 3beta-glucosyltransferase